MRHFAVPKAQRLNGEGETLPMRSVPVHINKNFTGRCVRIARSRVRVRANACVTREDGAVNRRVFRQVTLSTCTEASLPPSSDSLSFFRTVAQRDLSLRVPPPFYFDLFDVDSPQRPSTGSRPPCCIPVPS